MLSEGPVLTSVAIHTLKPWSSFSSPRSQRSVLVLALSQTPAQERSLSQESLILEAVSPGPCVSGPLGS